jgi:AcrR family transcriptional regulator
MTGRLSFRKTILREFAKLFREKGYLGATLREIAKRTGIKGGSVYNHFSSKPDILFEIMNYEMDELIEYVFKGIEKIDKPVERFREAVIRHIRYQVDHIAEMFVTDWELRSLTESKYSKIIEKRRIYERIFIDTIQAGVDEGVLVCEKINLTVYGILQMCTGVSVWYSEDGPLSPEDVGKSYFNLFIWGLNHDAPPRWLAR